MNYYNAEKLITENEQSCLEYLKKNLDDSYQVFCKPFFESSQIDFVVLKEGEKVLLIKVCENFSQKEFCKNAVKKVKNDITDRYIPELIELYKNNSKGYSLMQSLIWCNDSLEDSKNNYKCSLKNFLKPSYEGLMLDNNLQTKFLAYLEERNLVLEIKNNSIPQFKDFTQKQKNLSKSIEGKIQKIKGVAGAGKTLVLAQRAINAYERTKEKVLILTYNKSIVSHIKNVIWNLSGSYNYSRFCIDNVDNFISAQNNNALLGMSNFPTLEEISKTFHDKKNILPKYKAIFIDEIQDWDNEKITLIKEIFLADDGEFVVFGDEKQGIYGKENLEIFSEEEWSNLSEATTFRMFPKIAELATNFQKYFLKEEYNEIEEITSAQQELFTGEILYFQFYKKTNSVDQLTQKIIDLLQANTKNAAVVSYRENILQDIDFKIRETKRKTITTFLSKEFLKHTEKFPKNQREAKKGEKKTSLQSNFSLTKEGIKLSTIHSFKGYEADTLILIIQSWEDNDELIYTALTRAKEKLIVLNIENLRYKEFFKKNSKILIKKPFEFTVFETQEDNFELKKQLLEYKQKLKSTENLESKITNFEEEKKELKNEISEKEEKISKLRKDLRRKKSILRIFEKSTNQEEKLQKQIEELEKEKKELENKINKKEKKFKDKIESFKKEYDENLKKEKQRFENEKDRAVEKAENKYYFEINELKKKNEKLSNNDNFITLESYQDKNITVFLFGNSSLKEKYINGIFKQINENLEKISFTYEIIALEYKETESNAKNLENKIAIKNKGEYLVIIGAHEHSLKNIDKKSSGSFTEYLKKYGGEFILEVRKNQDGNKLDSIGKTNLRECLDKGIKLLK